MSSAIEIDQSGKIERTQENTALAFSNGDTSSILILAVEKRECIKRLRERGESGKTMYLKLFVAALFLLIEDHLGQLDQIAIDEEYPGKEAAIRRMLLSHIYRAAPRFREGQIVFRQVGKKSPAHHAALAVYRGTKQPSRKVKANELLRLIK